MTVPRSSRLPQVAGWPSVRSTVIPPTWASFDEIATDAAAILRVTDWQNDPDLSEFLDQCAEAAACGIAAYLDWPPDVDAQVDPPGPASLQRAAALTAVYAYQMKDAWTGIQGGYDYDQGPVRLPSDWLGPVQYLLLPYKQRFGIG